MGITKSNLEGLNWYDELLNTQERRIQTLKSTIEAMETIINIKDERIEILKNHIKQLQDER